MQKKLLYYSLFGIVFVFITGTLLHFIYEWSGFNSFVGAIAPVNESTWEHMKMLFFPMLFFTIWETVILKKEFPGILCGNVAGILSGTFLIPIIFYTYTGICGYHILFMDILTFLISVVLAFAVSFYVTKKEGNRTICLILSGIVFLLLICFLIFTFNPPDIGLFKIP